MSMPPYEDGDEYYEDEIDEYEDGDEYEDEAGYEDEHEEDHYEGPEEGDGD
jgi:hypothetical protein